MLETARITGKRSSGKVAVLVALVVLSTTALAEDKVPAAIDYDTLFTKLDADGDGVISESEIEAKHERLFRRLLRTSDANDDGGIDRSELAAGLKSQAPQRLLEQLPRQLPPDEQPAAVFARLDANGDGQLTTAEVPQQGRLIWAQFVEQADRNGDKSLNRVEFMRNYYRIARFLNRDPQQNKNMADAIFNRLDTDGDGRIRESEIPAERREQMARLFAFADSDGDGALTAQELSGGLEVVGRVMSGGSPAAMPSKTASRNADAAGKNLQGEVAELLRRAMQLDGNGDGKLDKQEVRGPLEQNFERIDADGSGDLDKNELSRVARFMIQRRPAQQSNP